MKIFLAALAVVGVAVFLLCFNIIFRKGKSFPDGEISHSKELRKRGIICANEEEMKLWGKNGRKKTTCSEEDCAGCPASCASQPTASDTGD